MLSFEGGPFEMCGSKGFVATLREARSARVKTAPLIPSRDDPDSLGVLKAR
jgi:hypothetical protein